MPQTMSTEERLAWMLKVRAVDAALKTALVTQPPAAPNKSKLLHFSTSFGLHHRKSIAA